MADGKGCTCAAWSSNECCCDADWTPQEVYDLRSKLDAALKDAERARNRADANAEDSRGLFEKRRELESRLDTEKKAAEAALHAFEEVQAENDQLRSRFDSAEKWLLREIANYETEKLTEAGERYLRALREFKERLGVVERQR